MSERSLQSAVVQGMRTPRNLTHWWHCLPHPWSRTEGIGWGTAWPPGAYTASGCIPLRVGWGCRRGRAPRCCTQRVSSFCTLPCERLFSTLLFPKPPRDTLQTQDLRLKQSRRICEDFGKRWGATTERYAEKLIWKLQPISSAAQLESRLVNKA